MKTTLLFIFIALILFTQRYKTSKPAHITYALSNTNDFSGFNNYVGWNNDILQPKSILHINSALTNFYTTGETYRITGPPISTYWNLLKTNYDYNVFIDSQLCIPAIDTCNIETDSEINAGETDTLNYYKPLLLPGC